MPRDRDKREREREREGGGKKEKKKGVKYTKRTFHGNQSVSRQSSVKKRRDESEASSICVVDSDTDSGTSKYHPTSSFRLE